MQFAWLMLMAAVLGSVCSLEQSPGRSRLSGFSDQYRSENTLGEYTFGYNEDHTSGGTFRRETSDRYGNKMGSYGLRVGDGRVRIVNYVADHDGFRADVVSNEPGLLSQNSNPHLKISKQNIYKIVVPGFRYSSRAPHLTFEGGEANGFRVQDGESVSSGSDFLDGKDLSVRKRSDGFSDVHLKEDGGRRIHETRPDDNPEGRQGFVQSEQDGSGIGDHFDADRNQYSNAGSKSYDSKEFTQFSEDETSRGEDLNRNPYRYTGDDSFEADGLPPVHPVDASQNSPSAAVADGGASQIQDVSKVDRIHSELDNGRIGVGSGYTGGSSGMHIGEEQRFDGDVVYDEYGGPSDGITHHYSEGTAISKSYDQSLTEDESTQTVSLPSGDSSMSHASHDLQMHQSTVVLSKSEDTIRQSGNVTLPDENDMEIGVQTSDSTVLKL